MSSKLASAAIATLLFAVAAGAGRETDRRLSGWAYDRALEATLTAQAPAATREAVLARAATAPVVLVDVSLEQSAGEGIVDRAELALVLDRVAGLGAQAIGLDIRFDAAGDPASDQLLAAAMRKAGNVVVASLKEPGSAGVTTSWFARHAAAQGIVNLAVDPRDGYLREVSHLVGAGQDSKDLLPSLTLVLLCRMSSLPGEAPPTWTASEDGLAVAGSRRATWIAVDESGRSPLLYRGPAGTIPTLPAEWLAAAPDLGGKAVLIGNARTDIRDSYLTPFGKRAQGRLSGVELQAQELAGLLAGEAWRMPGPWAAVLVPAAGAASGLALAWMLAPPMAAAASLAGAAALFELALPLFRSTGLLLVPHGAALALLLASAGWIVVRYGQLARSKRSLQVLLSTYFKQQADAEGRESAETMVRLMEAKDLLAPKGIEVLEPLGAGGMSFVFKARIRETGQKVALKVLSPDLFGDGDGRARFGHEARLAASLTHPNVVGVVRAGDETGVPYIAYELAEGPSLREVLRQRGRLPAGEAVRLARQLLAGLAAAHARGIIHRDVKPDNALVSADGTLRVADFGIARSDSDRDGFRTRTGLLLGTPSYMAPELLRDAEASARSDLYSVGCTLYELLTGSAPFGGDSASAVLLAHLEKPVPHPSTRGVEVPEPLWSILELTLAKDPGGRPVSAQDLAARLAPFETSETGDPTQEAAPPTASSATVRAARVTAHPDATTRARPKG